MTLLPGLLIRVCPSCRGAGDRRLHHPAVAGLRGARQGIRFLPRHLELPMQQAAAD